MIRNALLYANIHLTCKTNNISPFAHTKTIISFNNDLHGIVFSYGKHM